MAATNDVAIRAVAAKAAGICTRAELREAGVPARTISARIAAGFLRKVGSGLYEVPMLVNDQTPVVRAARAHPRGAISHVGAARLWGFVVAPPAPDEPVDVAVPRPVGGRPSVNGVRVHVSRRWSPADLGEPVSGLLATGPARTSIDLAGTTMLDRRLRHLVQSQIVAGQPTLAELTDCLHRLGGHGVTGSGRLERLLADLGGTRALAESELERRLAQLLDPRFECQFRLPGTPGSAAWSTSPRQRAGSSSRPTAGAGTRSSRP